eukprot:9066608-Heterocapsa_arctica.AAC.1
MPTLPENFLNDLREVKGTTTVHVPSRIRERGHGRREGMEYPPGSPSQVGPPLYTMWNIKCCRGRATHGCVGTWTQE